MADNAIQINRAPVLTLWGAVVAERLGHDPDAALTLGKAMAGLNGLGSLYSAKMQIGYALTLLIFAGLAWVNLAPNTWEIEPKPTWRYGVVFGLLLGAAVLAMGRPADFVYVQF